MLNEYCVVVAPFFLHRFITLLQLSKSETKIKVQIISARLDSIIWAPAGLYRKSIFLIELSTMAFSHKKKAKQKCGSYSLCILCHNDEAKKKSC